jgi:hypothetical protein
MELTNSYVVLDTMVLVPQEQLNLEQMRYLAYVTLDHVELAPRELEPDNSLLPPALRRSRPSLDGDPHA